MLNIKPICYNKKMNVYFSQEAKQYFKGLILMGSDLDGILIGHKRGYEYYIEGGFPYHEVFSMTDEDFNKINQQFDDRLIGFYTFSSSEKNSKKILVPFAVGKLFLKVAPGKEQRLIAEPYLIDYEKEFGLKSIKVYIF